MLDRSPKDDRIFRIIFGDRKHPKYLIHLLNTLLQPKSLIKSVQMLHGDLNSSYADDKLGRLDILAETESGEIVNIEMQTSDEHDFDKRSMFYWSKVYTDQAKKGEEYCDLHKTIFIGILDFVMYKNEPADRFWYKEIISDASELKCRSEVFERYFFELPKFEKQKGHKHDNLWFWLKFIINPNDEELKGMYRREEIFEEAKSAYDKCISDPETREYFRIRDKAERDYNSALTARERAGVEKGRKEGRQEGLIEGIRTKAIETARNFLAMGLSLEQVSKGTGLSIAEIEGLR